MYKKHQQIKNEIYTNNEFYGDNINELKLNETINLNNEILADKIKDIMPNEITIINDNVFSNNNNENEELHENIKN